MKKSLTMYFLVISFSLFCTETKSQEAIILDKVRIHLINQHVATHEEISRINLNSPGGYEALFFKRGYLAACKEIIDYEYMLHFDPKD